MVQHLNHQKPLTNAIKAMVSRYVDCYRRVQLYVVVVLLRSTVLIAPLKLFS